MSDEKHMMLAIEKARKGIELGQTPFGAIIVRGGEVISEAHNVVWKTTDITAHAEMHAIREACKEIQQIDLSGCTIYSTCEPCPMCFSAIHWARIDRIVFGARIADAENAGFNELAISNEKMKMLGDSPVKITADFMREPCCEIFKDFLEKEGSRVY